MWQTDIQTHCDSKDRAYALRHAGNKKLSWCWQTRAMHLEVNQGHQIVAFHMLGIVSSFAIITRRFDDIRLQKMLLPWNPGQRSLVSTFFNIEYLRNNTR